MRILYLPNEYSQQRQFEKKVWVYPVLMAMEAEWYRQQGHYVDFDADYRYPYPIGYFSKYIYEPEGLPFLSLPSPDRIFTRAKDKKYQSYGNYKYHPATHMQVADGCWHGKCTFCVENKKTYQVRDLEDVMSEIDECHALGFKEIFDDSGTFPIGNWLGRFCTKMSLKNYKIKLGCNMRLIDEDFVGMKHAGFRMVLFGVESANQSTLDRINKGVKADDIIPTIKKAAEAGLEPHIAVMFGYPWESEEEELKTLELVHFLLRKGYAKTAQASVYSVVEMEPRGGRESSKKLCKRIYEASAFPDFWFHKVKDLKTWEDFLYLLKGIRKGLTHA